MRVHPVAELFPMLPAGELQALAADIAAHGQQQPIVMARSAAGDVLLDGRNRLAACKIAGVAPVFQEYAGDSQVAYIIGVNLLRRHLEIGQKIALGLAIEPYYAEEAKKRMLAGVKPAAPAPPAVPDPVENVPQGSPAALAAAPAPRVATPPPAPPKSRDQAAKAVGVSGKTLSAAKTIQARAPEKFQAIIAGTKTVAAAKKELKADEDRAALATAQASITKTRRTQLQAVCDLRVCSCRELFASGILPDAVITDPPYPREYLEVFSELAEGCAVAGVPLVAVMSGQSYLPEVMRRLCEKLTYRWTLAYMTPGGQAVQQWQAKVNTAWKPVLLFGEAVEWFGDVAISKPNDNDKRFHGWGQSESGMADLVERLTKPGQLICDPFVGGGTTAVVALALGRRFVGCDISAEAVATTRQRVEAAS